MATEFNYVVNVDTSRVMSAMSEVRSQIGMAMQGPGAAGGMGNMASDASAQVGQMMASLGSMAGNAAGAGFHAIRNRIGQTHTSPAIANEAHYGAIQATSNLDQEWLIRRYGMDAANVLRPPGVSSFDYAKAVEMNAAQREYEKMDAAFTAARGVAVPLAAATAAYAPASLVGKGAAALFGAKIGGMAMSGVGFGVGLIASEVVAGAASDVMAGIEQERSMIREFGEIAAGGRDLSNTQRTRLGRAAMQASRDARLPMQAMGDILAGAGAMGMLPETLDPGSFRREAKELASAVDEVAQVLKTSLGNATRVIKSAGGVGLGAREYAFNLLNVAGDTGLDPMAVHSFGQQGAAVAKANLLNPSTGFQMFTQGLRAAAGSPDAQFLGGTMGASAMTAQAQMGMAQSPLGQLQLMAGQGGGGMPTDMMGLVSGAMDSMGGNFIGNMIRFQNNSDTLLRQKGASGIRQMARGQLDLLANTIGSIDPSLSTRDTRVAAARSMGFNPAQARQLVRGTFGGGGGGGVQSAGAAAELQAHMELEAGRAAGYDPQLGQGFMESVERRTTQMIESAEGHAAIGATLGVGAAMLTGAKMLSWGGIKGMAAGATIGLGVYGYRNVFEPMGEGIADLFMGDIDAGTVAFTDEMRKSRAMDARVKSIQKRYGLTVGESALSRVDRAPLALEQLTTNYMTSEQRQPLETVIARSNLQPFASQVPGTTEVGGYYYDTTELRNAGTALAAAPEEGRVVSQLAMGIASQTSPQLRQKIREFTSLARDISQQRQGGGVLAPEIAAQERSMGQLGRDILAVSPGTAALSPQGARARGVYAALTGLGATPFTLQRAVRGSRVVLADALEETGALAEARLGEALAGFAPGLVTASDQGAETTLGEARTFLMGLAGQENFKSAVQRGQEEKAIRIAQKAAVRGAAVNPEAVAAALGGQTAALDLGAVEATAGLIAGFFGGGDEARNLVRRAGGMVSREFSEIVTEQAELAISSGDVNAPRDKKKKGGQETRRDIFFDRQQELTAVQLQAMRNHEKSTRSLLRVSQSHAAQLKILNPEGTDATPSGTPAGGQSFPAGGE